VSVNQRGAGVVKSITGYTVSTFSEKSMLKQIIAAVAAFVASIGIAFAAIDANTASQAELEAVKGIGPAIAKSIVDERKNGSFKDLGDLEKRVKGIGENNVKKFAEAGLAVGGGKAAAVAKPAEAKKDAPKADAKPADSAKKDAPKADAKPAAAAAKADAKPSAADKAAADKAKKEEAAKAKKDAADKAKADKEAAAKAKKEAADKAKADKAAADKAKKDAPKADAAKAGDKPAAAAAPAKKDEEKKK
jgi:competence protein ComEA